MKSFNPPYFLTLIVLFAVFGFFNLVFAQDAVVLEVRPALFEESVEPGDVFSGELRITNREDVAQTFFLKFRDIVSVRADNTPIFASLDVEKTGLELSSWASFDEGPYDFEPGETKTIPFTISFPENAGPGGHFGALFLSRSPDRPEAIGSGVGFDVGALMNFRMAGEIFEEARIREFMTESFVHSEPEVNFTALVENLGNVLVRPTGFVKITGMFGGTVDEFSVNERGAGVFPETDRRFEFSWEPDEFLFGRYQAVLSMVYGESEKTTINSATSFWIIPMNLVVYGLGGFALFVLVIAVSVQVYIRRKLKMLADSQNISVDKVSYPGKPVSHFAIMAVAALLATLTFILIIFLMLA